MNASLASIREHLDDVDQRIIEALAERQALVRQAAAHKTHGGVRVPHREAAILRRLHRQADAANLDRALVTSLYRTIFEHSVRLQESMLAERPANSASSTNPPPSSPPSEAPVNGHSNGRRNGRALHDAASATPASRPTRPQQDASSDTPHPLAARSNGQGDTVVQVGDIALGGDMPVLIGGPCSVESRDQIMACAEAVSTAGGHILRGGCFKPRTSPYSFQGLGFEGLDLLADAGRTFGLPIITEVMHPADVMPVAEQADILQIGARNMQNFELLKAAGRSHRPVMLKRGMMATIDEWLSAAEYVMAHGNEQVILCQRGIRTFESATRFTLDLTALPVVRERTHLPVVVDPSHACGRRRWVPPLAQGALAAGAQGLMVEMHPHPEAALSDGPQSLTVNGFRELATRLHAAGAVAA